MPTENLDIYLRPTELADLDFLFQLQMDKEARYLAAFMSTDSTDKTAYIRKYTSLLGDSTVNNQTILYDNAIMGSIASFDMEGNREITYWIDRNYWGKGLATKAVQQFLKSETFRPLYGRVAVDNIGSQKVLERSGFIKIGSDKGYANARQTVVDEFIYQLSN